MMTYEKSTKVYQCCGQYIVPTKAVKDSTDIVCTRCGEKVTGAKKTPVIVIVSK